MSEAVAIRDHREPNAKITRMLSRAADQRARGVRWSGIAQALNRSQVALCEYVALHAATWERLLRLAEGRVFREAGSEALQVMRTLLRAESETIQRDVGRTLTNLMFRSTRDNTGELVPLNPREEAVMDFVTRENAHDQDEEENDTADSC